MPAEHPALHLIQEIRDEAHRFAISGHRAQRGKTRRTSRLEDIAGIGPKRRKALISHFGGLQGIANAGIDQLTAVPESARNWPKPFTRLCIDAIQHTDPADLAAHHPDPTDDRRLLCAVVVDAERRPDLAATVIFVVAAITDWLDGYLARRWNETSAFGAFLDPVADKLMVAAALIVLVQLDRVDAMMASIIIGREITISALREWMAQIGAHKSVAVQ